MDNNELILKILVAMLIPITLKMLFPNLFNHITSMIINVILK